MSPNKQPSRTETIQQLANQSEAYRNFIDSINSETSRYEYAKNIRYFLDFTGLPDYDSLLEIDEQQIETKIIMAAFIIPSLNEERFISRSVRNILHS
jgi:hypothetical protein